MPRIDKRISEVQDGPADDAMRSCTRIGREPFTMKRLREMHFERTDVTALTAVEIQPTRRPPSM